MTVAKKEHWQTKPFPESVKDLVFEKAFSQTEFEKVKSGLIPKQMEDKWFIYYENNTLYFHRSWTGHLIYRLTLSHAEAKTIVTGLTVNRDPEQYSQQDDAYDIRLLHFLIDRLLLNKNVPFPSPGHLDENTTAVYRHSMIGYGRSNTEE